MNKMRYLRPIAAAYPEFLVARFVVYFYRLFLIFKNTFQKK